jgi:hypothetical protein
MTARIPDVFSGEGGQLAEILERRVRRTVPGVAVACVRDGEIVLVSTRGLASAIGQAPMRSHTVNHWFSMTKLVTATAVMQLVDSGRITLGDPGGAPRVADLSAAVRCSDDRSRSPESYIGSGESVPVAVGAHA